MKLDIAREAGKFLEELDAKQYKQMARKFFALSENSTPSDSLQLTGLP